MKCVEKSPSNRYQSVEEIFEDLKTEVMRASRTGTGDGGQVTGDGGRVTGDRGRGTGDGI